MSEFFNHTGDGSFMKLDAVNPFFHLMRKTLRFARSAGEEYMGVISWGRCRMKHRDLGLHFNPLAVLNRSWIVSMQWFALLCNRRFITITWYVWHHIRVHYACSVLWLSDGVGRDTSFATDCWSELWRSINCWFHHFQIYTFGSLHPGWFPSS